MGVCQVSPYLQNNGRRFSNSCGNVLTHTLAARTGANCSSRPFSGSLAQERSGGCFQPSTASGTPSTNALPDGATGASGSECTSISLRNLTWNTSSSTVRSSGLTSALRAHPKRGGQPSQALGRSRGGFSTKVHVSVDGLGNPLRFKLTPGQKHDITQAEMLISGYEGEYVIADKGYDSQGFIQHISDSGMVAVIPPRSNRKQPRSYDDHLYRERHLVECFIGKMKHYRRIFSRFDKLDSRYLGFLQFAAVLIWLR